MSGYLVVQREWVLPEREECAPIKFVDGTPNRLSWTLGSETRPIWRQLERDGADSSPRETTKAAAVADERRNLRMESEGLE